MKCKHSYRGTDLFVQHCADGQPYDPASGGKPIAWRCANCGEYANLGPSRDDGEHAAAVATELRAAELEQWWHDADPAEAFDFVRRLSDDEARGWSIAETSIHDHTNAWHAGFLARVIATHTEGE